MRERNFRALKVKWNPARKMYEPVLSEEMVLKEIVTRLWMQGRIKVWRVKERIPGYGELSTPGISDLIGVVPGGKAIFLEVKRPGGVHRIAQTQFIDEVKVHGAIAGFVDSWDSCRRLFREYGIELAA